MASNAIVDVVPEKLLDTFVVSDQQVSSVNRLPADPFLKPCHAASQVKLSPEFMDGVSAECVSKYWKFRAVMSI
jgi:hypothetical protein